MGCGASKVDDLPAVALCRSRLGFLDDAIHRRYDLADAHLAYLHSLKSVGSSLHRFFDPDLSPSADFPPSPVLNLPPSKKKGELASSAAAAPPPPPPVVEARRSGSNSGSHLHFQSDSDDDDDDDDDSLGCLHHSDHSSPLHDDHHGHVGYSDGNETLGSFPVGGNYGGGGGFMHMNYMKSRAMPSVSYEQRPMSPETGRIGESSLYYNDRNPTSSFSYYGNPNYGGGMNGYLGMQPPYGSLPPAATMPSSSSFSSSRPPPLPPSPPRNSPWDFMNLFTTAQNIESSYPTPYTPSRDSKEVREEEGIPDLEDEDYQQEVVKEVHGTREFVDSGAGIYSKSGDSGDGRESNGEALYHSRPSTSIEEEDTDYEVHVVDKKVVVDEEKPKEQGNMGAFKDQRGPRGISEVVREIQAQFDRASESGNELSKMLEVGKLPYRKNSANQAVSSKMLHAISPSLSVVPSQPSAPRNAEPSTSALPGLDFVEELGIRSKNLSSTLQKCYLWEKKLYNEVKAEEKLRILHERKCRKLKHLDERGAETHKVDSTRTLIRSLSTKIRIAIQVVDKISVKINKLRDEELWPQISELIQGLTKMWKSMLECHHSQCQALKEAPNLDAIAFHKKFSDNHLAATLELEQDLINWTLRFSSWIRAQKGYVQALNNWLLKCLLYVPEETPDGIAPFSPGRMGAPPLFVICNQWCQSLERISEKEVVDSIRVLATSVLQLWERDKLEMQHRMMTNKDLERKVKNLEREDLKIQKGIQALDKMALVSGDGGEIPITEKILHQGETSKNNSLQSCLQHIFEAMERLAANSTKAYEELLQRSEEDRLPQDRAEVS